MKNLLFILFVLFSFEGCNKDQEKEAKWDPQILLMDGEENLVKIDTLTSGTIYKRTIVTSPESYNDKQGNDIIRNNQEMKLSIGLDTFPRGQWPEYININKYLSQNGNLAKISIPVDSLISEFNLKDSIMWTIEARIIDDSLYVDQGKWIINQ